jgi:RNA recognition motif-containing protein
MELHVGGLPFKLSEKALSELFEAYGQVVSVKIIIDRRTGQSKGYGFVEMDSQATADAAIAALNGCQVLDRNISVQPAGQKPVHTGPKPKSKYDIISEKYAEQKNARKKKWDR